MHPLRQFREGLKYRQGERLTLAQVAAMLNCSAVTVCRYEKRQRVPRGTVLRRIAAVTGIPMDELVNASFAEAAE